MSKELDDVTRALAELRVVVRRFKANADVETAITQVVDCLVMALGEIEVRLDFARKRSLGGAPLNRNFQEAQAAPTVLGIVVRVRPANG